MTATPLTAAERVENVTGRTAFGQTGTAAFLAAYADDCDVLVTVQEHDGEPRTLLSVQIAWELIEADAELWNLGLDADDLHDLSGHDEIVRALTDALHGALRTELRADNRARFLDVCASDLGSGEYEAVYEYADGAAFDPDTGDLLLSASDLADFYDEHTESFVPGLDDYARTATDLLAPAVERRTVQYIALNAA